ncbi:MAG: hypothetical protein OEY94_07230 [Alphaproteobacteria bacterium]|nr:hypothetical protein [Alphaproteobacteria bacterium]
MITSIILALHFFGFIPVDGAVSFLYVVGALLLIAEVGVVSFGILAVNGLIALYAAYSLQTGHLMFFNLPVDWGLLFGIAFIEFASLAIAIIIWRKLKNMKSQTGTEGMIGQTATVVNWDGLKGTVLYEGEIWKAESGKEMDLNKDDKVSIESVGKMKLIVTA